MNHSWILSLPPSLPLVSELKIQSVTLSETYCRAALRSIGEKKQRPGQPARNAQPACRAILSPIRSLRSRETAFNAKTEANEKKSKKKKREKRNREKRGGKKSRAIFRGTRFESGKQSVGTSPKLQAIPLAHWLLVSLLASSSAEYLWALPRRHATKFVDLLFCTYVSS